MKHTPLERVGIVCEVHDKTVGAWLVYDGATEAWIPTRQISAWAEESNIFGKKLTRIFIPFWLAIEKGLA
jgi:hypothetical protein